MLTLLVIARMTGSAWSLIETILLLSAVQKVSKIYFSSATMYIHYLCRFRVIILL